jgi:archaeal type IV pilus assembly protein PilA
MKANASAVSMNEDAVSPVIAVILMVAITVVLAATVYIWVSGFGTSGAIKRFPLVNLKDVGADAAPFAADEALAVIEHRGGDTINLGDYTVNVFRDGVEVSAVDFDTAESCSAGTAAPTGALAVGGKFYICTTDATWSDGDELKVQVIDATQNSIVYENSIVVS